MIGGNMKFYGLLGERLSHSISPQIHGFIFQELNIVASYSLFPVPPDRLGDAVSGLRLLGAGGVNVTMPYKLKIIPLLDELSDEAKELGAVNTVSFRQGRGIGYNTDYAGFGLLLKLHKIATAGAKAIVLGTGGAAITAACWLKDHGAASVKLVSRFPTGTERYETISYDDLCLHTEADILVNATPVGMFPNIYDTPLTQALLPRFGVVVDLIYNPSETMLMQQARAAGVRAVNGLTMLVAQAIAGQEIWQNRSFSAQMLTSTCDYVSQIV